MLVPNYISLRVKRQEYILYDYELSILTIRLARFNREYRSVQHAQKNCAKAYLGCMACSDVHY